ncbi:MAG: hypothetical protein ACYC4U_31755, partial [Pirellulaceae bacterium]
VQQIPIMIDDNALDQAGIGRETPITISIRGISLRSLLKLMLSEPGLTYVVRDQVLQITTPEKVENQLEVRVYPVADLAVADRQSVVVGEPTSSYRTILDVISDNVAPTSWEQVGGAASSWSFDPWGILAVSQTRENHEAVASLLAAVRKARNSRANGNGSAADWQPIPVLSDAKLAAHARIEQALDAIVEVDFAEMPLSDVVKYLEDAHGVPIWINRRALEDVGTSGDSPVTFSMQSVSLRSALRLMLRPLDLVYQIDEEVLKITTRDQSEQEMTVRVYPVGDFLDSSSSAGGNSEQSQSLDRLQDVIESTVMPETWEHVGGNGVFSSVVPWGLLVISQTEEVHERVNSLLQTARRARAASPLTAGAPPWIPPPMQLPQPDDPFVPPTPPLLLPGSSAPLNPPGFLSSDGDTMILKVYAVPDFAMEQLMPAIRSIVAPETWGDGPGAAAIFPLGARVLIRQTPAMHAEIRELIEGLRLDKGSGTGGFF